MTLDDSVLCERNGIKSTLFKENKMEYNISHNAKALLDMIPESGAAIGNVTLRKNLGYDTLEHTGTEYQDARQELLDAKLITLGRGKGGSVKRVVASIEDEIPF